MVSIYGNLPNFRDHYAISLGIFDVFPELVKWNTVKGQADKLIKDHLTPAARDGAKNCATPEQQRRYGF